MQKPLYYTDMRTTHTPTTLIQKFRNMRMLQSIALGTMCSALAFAVGMETAGEVHPFATSEAAVEHTVTPAQPYAAVQGDIDHDGELTAKDAMRILDFAAGWDTPTTEEVAAGDADGDFHITLKDVERVLRAVSLR